MLILGLVVTGSLVILGLGMCRVNGIIASR